VQWEENLDALAKMMTQLPSLVYCHGVDFVLLLRLF
jgi:hypothetical protein